MKIATGLIATMMAGIAASAAHAQAEYPARTIELLVGYSPGGAIDLLARQAQPFLERHLGEDAEVVVVNMPGAGGALMHQRLAMARPDGYTVGLLSMPSVVSVLFGGDVDYTIDDFAYAGTLTFEPHSIMVGNRTPYETIEDLMEAAREAPGTVTLGGAGIGSAAHLAIEVLAREADVEFNFIPAPGAAEMVNQVLGGHIAGGATTISASYSHHEEDQARVLGVLAAERVDLAPDIPTFREAGYDVQWGALRGIVAPAGTPPEIIEQLTEAIRLTVEDPEFQAVAERNQIILSFLDGEEFRQSVEDVYVDLQEIWEESPWIED